MKCAVKDCENHEHQGRFIGGLCSPCYRYLTGDNELHSQLYRNVLKIVDAAVSLEREQCARVCESQDELDARYRYDYRRAALDCADAIRRRPQ